MSGNEPASAPPPPNIVSPVEAGTVLSGKFRVERVLNAGGMGVILVAHHLHLDRRVAIKVLRTQAAESPELVARFAREARAVAKLTSDHVVRVLDVGTLESGAPYMVMEHLHGSDLSRLLQATGPLSVHDAVDYILQACEGLAEAHAMGIVHRDLKPANLFLSRTLDGAPLVKVLDFGISKVAESESESITKTAVLMGSPSYISPEQLRSARTVDARSDIWALGAVLFKLLTGKVPFSAPSEAELVVEILHGEPRSLRGIREELPEALEQVILRCLRKKADDRFASVVELAKALEPSASAEGKKAVARVEAVARRSGMFDSATSSGNALVDALADSTTSVPNRPKEAAPAREPETLSEPGDASVVTPRPHAKAAPPELRVRGRRATAAALAAVAGIVVGFAAWSVLRAPPSPRPAGLTPIEGLSSSPLPSATETTAPIATATALSIATQTASASATALPVAPKPAPLESAKPRPRMSAAPTPSPSAPASPLAPGEDPRFGGTRK